MGSYLGDWAEAEKMAAAAHAAYPDCTEQLDCPATEHLLLCRRFRKERVGIMRLVERRAEAHQQRTEGHLTDADKCPAGHQCHRSFPPPACRDYETCKAGGSSNG